VEEIRALVPVEYWSHCPGAENPADIPSRGILPTQLASSTLWWSGPKWLSATESPAKENIDNDVVPVECRIEMKVKDQRALDKETLSTMLVYGSKDSISNVINCKGYSSLGRLLRVSAVVLKFIKLLKSRVRQEDPPTNSEVTSTNIELVRVLWIKELQEEMKLNEKFKSWNRDLGLFTDENGTVRCKGRLSNSNLPYSAKYPILLDTAHYLTTLIVRDCHKRVMHGRVKATLTELRSKFWLVRGRNFVRKLLFNCVTCKKQDGRAYKALNSPPLPEFRVKEAPPFTSTSQARAFYLRWAAAKTLVQAGHVTPLFTLHLGAVHWGGWVEHQWCKNRLLVENSVFRRFEGVKSANKSSLLK
jgi:hypothetical protein